MEVRLKSRNQINFLSCLLNLLLTIGNIGFRSQGISGIKSPKTAKTCFFLKRSINRSPFETSIDRKRFIIYLVLLLCSFFRKTSNI